MTMIKPQKSLAVKNLANSYRLSTKTFHGLRPKHLIDPQKRSVLKNKPKAILAEYCAFACIVALGFCHTFILTSGFLSTVVFFTYTVVIAFSIKLLRDAKRTNKAVYDAGQEFAIYNEPKGLWLKEFPTEGERGELITALLSARRLYKILEGHTSIPLGMGTQDPYICHLIDEVAASNDNDIHEYLYHEINHICESALMYGEMYTPVIGLDGVPEDWE